MELCLQSIQDCQSSIRKGDDNASTSLHEINMASKQVCIVNVSFIGTMCYKFIVNHLYTSHVYICCISMCTFKLYTVRNQIYRSFVQSSIFVKRRRRVCLHFKICIPIIISNLLYFSYFRYLNLAITSTEIRKQDAVDVMVYVSQNPIGQALTWDFVRANWNYLMNT